MSAGSRVSRRTFVQAVAGATALSAASYRQVLGANERVRVGFIGYGLIGKRHVLDFQAQPDVACVGISDAHVGRRAEAREQMGRDCREYDDFRKLLDSRDVDAVVISTPDHWHALMTMLACAAGKDVYVEKPLTLFVREGQWMIDVAKRTGRIVQVGTQQRSGPHYQRARELIQSGAIGKIHTVRMGAVRNIMPGFGTPANCDPPAELDWDAFVGPGPMHPYNPNRGIYMFRFFWDSSGGQMTNLGQHQLDIAHWYLGGDLQRVASFGGRYCLEDNGETPDTQDALFEFAGQETASGRVDHAWTATWTHREGSVGTVAKPSLEFFGTTGGLKIDRKGFTLTPDKKTPPEKRVPQFTGEHPVGGPPSSDRELPEVYWREPLVDKTGNDRAQFVAHVRNFLDCIVSRKTPNSDLESSHRVSTMCHLANLSLRLGRQLRWDAAKQEVIDDAEASQHLTRPYRSPWDAELKALGIG